MTEEAKLVAKCSEHVRDAETYCDHCEELLCPRCVIRHKAPPHNLCHLEDNKEEIMHKFNERIEIYKQFKERLGQKLLEMTSGEFLQDFSRLAVQVREELADIETNTVVPLISFQEEQNKVSLEWLNRAGALKGEVDHTDTEWVKEKRISNKNVLKFKALKQGIIEISQIIEGCPEVVHNPFMPNQAELAGQFLMKILKMLKVANCVPWRAATIKSKDFKAFGIFTQIIQTYTTSK